jgi:A118 family predicted phage portal protein
VLSQIWSKVKELIGKMTGRNIENILHIQPTISSDMTNAIEQWDLMYRNKAPWLKKGTLTDPVEITSLGLPAFIVSEKARMCTLEMKSEITGRMEEQENIDENTGLQYRQNVSIGNTSRADYLNEQYQNTIMRDIRVQLEYGLAKGGLAIKPYVMVDDNGQSKILMDYIQADGFYPISFDASGRITEAAFVQRIIDKQYTYSRLEHHKLDGHRVTVVNRAFRSVNTKNTNISSQHLTELGTEISLTDVPAWEDLEPETVIENVDRLLFAYFKVPIANTIDTYSPLGISVYEKAKDLIKDADKQYSRLKWEFEGGELAIDVDREALTMERDEHGNDVTVHSELQNRLFRKIDLNNESTYNVFNPVFRDVSLLNGLNTMLMRIEDVCELARGTLSDVNQDARTATEIAVLKQRSYAANAQLQKALESTLKDVVYIMDVYATLYELAPDGDYDVSIEWDDSIEVDRESEMSKRLTLVQNGLSSKVEFRMWYYGETEEQAIQALDRIQKYNSYEMQSNINSEETEV